MNEHLSRSQFYLQTTTTTITTLMPPSSSAKLLPERPFRSTPKGLSGMLSSSSRKRPAEDQVEERSSRARLFEIPDSEPPSSSLFLHRENQNIKPFSISLTPRGGTACQEPSASASVNDLTSVVHQPAPKQTPSSIVSKGARSVIRSSPLLSTNLVIGENGQHKTMHLTRRRAIQPPPPMTPVSNPRSSPHSYALKDQDRRRFTGQSSPEFEDRHSIFEDGYMHPEKGSVHFEKTPFAVRRDHEGFPAGIFDDDEDDMFMQIGAEQLFMSQEKKNQANEGAYRGDSADEEMDLDQRRHGSGGKNRFNQTEEDIAHGRYDDDEEVESMYRGRPIFSSDDRRSFNSLRTSSRSFDPTANHETTQQGHSRHTGFEIDPSLSLLGQLIMLKGGKVGEAYEKMKEKYAQETLSTEQWEARGKELGTRFNVLAQKMIQHTKERADVHRAAIEQLEAHDLILSNRSTVLEAIQRGLAGKASSLLDRS